MHKSIFIIRHAKSSWNLPVKDIERPLNDRGLRDAPIMGEIFKRLIAPLLKVVSSPANRAHQTAIIFMEACNISEKIILDESLYYGEEEDYLSAIQTIEDKYNSVAIFGHNPKVENFSRNIHDGYHGEIPTCAIMQFGCTVEHWKEVEWNNIKFVNKYFPKKI
ncbi:MAG: histidine phosphatase family protein [Saprospiraceae bacterium]